MALYLKTVFNTFFNYNVATICFIDSNNSACPTTNVEAEIAT